VIEEMKLLMRAGFTLEEAIGCASGNAGLLVGPRSGLLQEGNPATFIVVEAEPYRLPEELSRIERCSSTG
jgi:imidazolonepropionase-like amidohydrolase